MSQQCKNNSNKLALIYTILPSLAVSFTNNCTLAQIVPDRSLGSESSVVTTDNNVSTIKGGATRDSNLFHSFEQFSVNTGSSAHFNNPDFIKNIFSRITGNSISNIDGLVKANGSANLFLINPNGIIFGPNASLNIGGSFVGSTAESIRFADGSEFSTKETQTAPLLTVNVPIGLQLPGNTQDINVLGSNLEVKPEKTLAFIGGDVNLNGAQILAPGGRVDLGGVSTAGIVGLNIAENNLSLSFPEALAKANISLTDGAEVNVRSGGGGSIGINAANLKLLGESSIQAGIENGQGSAESQAGNIDINATGIITLDGSSIVNTIGSKAEGNGGNINISAESLLLSNSAQLDASTYAKGNAGNITIDSTREVSFDGELTAALSSAFPESQGKAGLISITTNSLSVTNGALLGSVSLGEGDAGNIEIDAADSITLSGVGSMSGISSGLYAGTAFDASKAGGISVKTSVFRVTEGAIVNAQTTNNGQGGNIVINTDIFEATGGGQVITSTISSGKAGDITIDASERITLSGIDPTFADRLKKFTETFVRNQGAASGVFANTSKNSKGNGGNLTINTGELIIKDGAKLTASSEGKGNAGNIIEIIARNLTLDNGSITTTSKSGEGGNIEKIEVQNLLILRDRSKISTTAGTENNDSGNGGNINNLNAGFIVAAPSENNDITANAFQGRGGKITINARGIIGIFSQARATPLSDITASSQLGINGIITINTPELDPTQGLVVLPEEVIDVSALIDRKCSIQKGSALEIGQLTITGRGGLPSNPGETIASQDLWEDWRFDRVKANNYSDVNNVTHLLPKQKSDVENIEAIGWTRDEKGKIVLIANISNETIERPNIANKICVSH